jgi:hypothetical protein
MLQSVSQASRKAGATLAQPSTDEVLAPACVAALAILVGGRMALSTTIILYDVARVHAYTMRNLDPSPTKPLNSEALWRTRCRDWGASCSCLFIHQRHD